MKTYNLKYTTMLYLLTLVSTHSTFTMEQPSTKLEVSNKSLATLYKHSYSSHSLYINPKDLPNSYIDLKELFKKNNLIAYDWPTKWTDTQWERTYSYLKEQTKTPKMNTLDELPTLLKDAKLIIKSFLATDNWLNSNLPQPKNFIEKSIDPNLNRLFTYAFIQRVIEAKKLTRIRLPRKILVIQDKKTGQYISNKEAQKVIDDTLKIYVYSLPYDDWNKEVNFRILFNSDQYNCKFFADKKSKMGSGLNEIAMNELFTLCKIAPFDIGTDNIFWDTQGDAIIIDTEYKGESPQSCTNLNRYPTIKSSKTSPWDKL